MPTYIGLVDFTDRGMQSIKTSPDRADAFRKSAEAAGQHVKDLYWCSGGHDGVVIVEAEDDYAASALFLALNKTGNVRTRMLRAYGREEMQKILASVD